MFRPSHPVLLSFLASLVLGVFLAVSFHLGELAGRGETYAEAYAAGSAAREVEMAKAVEAIAATVGPMELNDDMDCQTLSLVAARAGELVGIHAAAAAVGL